MHTFANGFWPIFPIFWGLFWVAVIGLAVWARRRGYWGPRQARTEARPTATAEQILAERYARGELGDDEYFEKISVLKGGSS